MASLLSDPEHLEAYRASLEFVAWSEPGTQRIAPKPTAIDQRAQRTKTDGGMGCQGEPATHGAGIEQE